MRDIAKYEQDYAAQLGFEKHMVRLRRRAVLEFLGRYPHPSILEVGCGLRPLLADVPQFRSLTICEPAPSFVQEARRQAAGRDGVTIVEGFLEEQVEALSQRAYDVIVASSLLHEVSDPERFLAALHRLCGPETVVHINVPNRNSLHVLLGVALGLIQSTAEKSGLAQLYQRTSTFDLDELARRTQAAGFQVLDRGSYFLKPFTHAQMDQLLNSGIVPAGILDALYDVTPTHFPEHGAEIFVNVRRAG